MFSSNADLSTLSISKGILSPSFLSAIVNYTTLVDNSVSSVTITPQKSELNATIQVQINNSSYTAINSGSSSSSLVLNVGDNVINVKVTAQDGTIKIYTITVTRISNNADLSSLAISQVTLSPVFTVSTTVYTATVTSDIISISVTPVVFQANATIEIQFNNGGYTTENSGTASSTYILIAGINTIQVKVTAQDGITTKIYTINITRLPSNIADLGSIYLSSGILTPVFSSNTLNYTDTVLYSVKTISFSPRLSSTNNNTAASISMNFKGAGFVNTKAGVATRLTLDTGKNILVIKVIAEDGITTKLYNVTIIRLIPPVISYNVIGQPLLIGTTITPILPINTGGAASSFDISPVLLNGLLFDTTTGEISGTPLLVSSNTTYSITA